MTGYHLLDHPNPHARDRGQGRRFHGYPGRRAEVRLVVLHTSESAFDLVGPDRGAEAVAGFLDSVERPSSYHAIADRDSAPRLLPWSYTAFGAHRFNSDAVHIAVAGTAADWNDLEDDHVDQILDQLAPLVDEVLDLYELPPVVLTPDQARTNGRGLTGHGVLDPTRRTDPGADFPWDRLLARLQEDDMALFNSREEFEDFLEHVVHDVVQDAVFKAGFGRTNPESFGDRVGHIRVDTRAANAKLDAVLELLAEDHGLDVDELAERVAAKLNQQDADGLLDALHKRLAQ